jgi:copper chaperone CopZ
MERELIIVENVKCNGCANTIKRSLGSLPGVQEVLVDIEQSTVEVVGIEKMDRETLVTKLLDMGYPEIGKGSLWQTGQSYVSCMLGKF